MCSISYLSAIFNYFTCMCIYFWDLERFAVEEQLSRVSSWASIIQPPSKKLLENWTKWACVFIKQNVAIYVFFRTYFCSFFTSEYLTVTYHEVVFVIQSVVIAWISRTRVPLVCDHQPPCYRNVCWFKIHFVVIIFKLRYQ